MRRVERTAQATTANAHTQVCDGQGLKANKGNDLSFVSTFIDKHEHEETAEDVWPQTAEGQPRGAPSGGGGIDGSASGAVCDDGSVEGCASLIIFGKP